MSLKKKTWLYIVLIALAVGLSAWLLVRYNRARPEPAVPSVTPRPTPEVIVKETEVEKIVEVEKEITSSVIEDGLRDIGVLVTQEYYFTDVISFSSVKKLFRVEVPFTETSYLASYDGVVTAGIDFGKVSVVKDDAAGKIVVTLPPAEILNVDVDPETFELYSERTGLGNPLSVEDFNDSIVTLESNVRQKALDKGLLLKADENARAVVRNFIAGLVDTGVYSVVFAD